MKHATTAAALSLLALAHCANDDDATPPPATTTDQANAATDPSSADPAGRARRADAGAADSGGASADGAVSEAAPPDARAPEASAPDGATSGACLFPCDNPWYADVSALPAYTGQDLIGAIGGWGRSNRMTIDFSIVTLAADASTPRRPVALDPSYDPDNDHLDVPVPANGAVEGESGYTCTQGGDCHLIVVDSSQGKLFELWQASYANGAWTATQETVWDLTKHYGPEGRGYGCTSADAAGLAIFPGLIRPSEVASGEIRHALRFILPGSKIQHDGYVVPATHSTSAYSGKMPMGTRLRLKASFDESTLSSQGAKVVARAMKRYGMLLADAGQDALTAESDQLTSVKWSGLLGALDLQSLAVTDFEVVDFGTPRVPASMDCVRAP